MNRWKAKKGSGETKGDTQKSTKMPFFQGENWFFLLRNKEKQKKKTKQTNKKQTQKTNKEGLGPSKVALRATSPDP